MAKRVWKGGTMLAPVPPTMITCGDMENSNIITVAWTGILNTDPPKTYISVRKERFSHALIKESGEFVINLTSERLCSAADFCGFRSGRDVDKFEKLGLQKEKASVVKCPLIDFSPLHLECKVTQVIELGSHDMFVADIVAVDVDEKYIDENDKLCLDKARLVSYIHGEYFKLGEKIGKFGYSIQSKKSRKM